MEEIQERLDHIDTARMIDHVRMLASLEFAGRRLGTEGNRRSRLWLKNMLEAWGYGVKEISFEADVWEFDDIPRLYVKEDSDATISVLQHRSDYAMHMGSPPTSVSLIGPLHLPGRSLEDAGGKWVVRSSLSDSQLAQLTKEVVRVGGLGVFLLRKVTGDGYFVKQVRKDTLLHCPVFIFRDDDWLLQEHHRFHSFVPAMKRVTVRGASLFAQLNRVEGTDFPSGSGLVITAHYDGVGDDPDGKRFPGASDNASGVAVLLELARMVAAVKRPPIRPIFFLLFDGEEYGALGSRHVARLWGEQKWDLPPWVINLDTVARMGEMIWIEAGGEADPLIRALDEAGKDLSIPLSFGTVASDNRPFARQGFPSVGVSSGGFGIHTPADTAERVEGKALERAARLILWTMWRLAFDGS